MSTQNTLNKGLQSTRERVLALLRAADGWCSGESLSRELGVSRAAVAKHVAVLREAGYEIDAAPRRGYRLLFEETYSEAAVRAALGSVRAGQGTWLWLGETESTNRNAVALALEGGPDGSVVVADRQQTGRGRQGKSWFTAPGSLAFSLLWRFSLGEPENKTEALPAAPEKRLTRLLSSEVEPLLLRLLAAVGNAVAKETGLPIVLKEPNDLLLHGRKCCGMLVETGTEVNEVAWLVLGVGLNVNASASDFPPHLAGIATSLAMEKGTRFNRASLLCAVLLALEQELVKPSL